MNDHLFPAPKKFSWLPSAARLVALAATVGSALVALANPNCPAGEVCAEVVRGAMGGALLGLVLTALRHAGWF